jgi:hypothetical protein
MALTTYNQIKEQIKDELEQLKDSSYPEDIITELADSEVPFYYAEIIEEWCALDSDDIDCWKEQDQKAVLRITELMAYDLSVYYTRQFLMAWEDIKEELEID